MMTVASAITPERFRAEVDAVTLQPTDEKRHADAVELMARTLKSLGYDGAQLLDDRDALRCQSRCPTGECWAMEHF